MCGDELMEEGLRSGRGLYRKVREPWRMWSEVKSKDDFVDPDLPIDSDWLSDMESGCLFGGRGRTAYDLGRRDASLDINRVLIQEAVRFAEEMGLTTEYLPRLKIIEGVVYAMKPDEENLPLEYSLNWEYQTGYADLVDELLETMRAERLSAPRFRGPKVPED